MSEDNDPSRLLVTVKRTLGVLLSLFVTFLGLLLVTFVIARIVPIDPVLSILGDRATDAQIAAERLRLGLDEPMWKQFAIPTTSSSSSTAGTSISSAIWRKRQAL